MTQQSTNGTFHIQTNQHENSRPTDANSVEFLNGTPTNLPTNPKRIWIDQTTEELKYTVDGVDIHGAADSSIVYQPFPTGFLRSTALNQSVWFRQTVDDPIYFPRLKSAGINFVMLAPNLSISGSGTVTYSGDINDFIYAVAKIKAQGIAVGFKVHYGNSVPSVGNQPNFFATLETMLKQLMAVDSSIVYVGICNEGNNFTNSQTLRPSFQTLITNLKAFRPTIKTFTSALYTYDYMYERSTISDLVDVLGTNYYPGVSTAAVPTVDECLKHMLNPITLSWDNMGFKDVMEAASVKYGKPYMITEIGIPFYEDTAARPGISNVTGKTQNPQVQANYLTAVTQLPYHLPNCIGITIWTSSQPDVYCWYQKDVSYQAIKDAWGNV